MSKNDHLQVTSSSVIDYPASWADHTGPFGGAFAWALENLLPHTEVQGIRVDTNSYGRQELYKFRLIRGPNDDVRGKMELEGGQCFSLKNGNLGLVTRQEEWSRRYVMVERDGRPTWELEWERVMYYQPVCKEPPLMAMALISKCSEMANLIARPLRRNWCREVFGVSFEKLRDHRVHGRLVTGPATDNHRALYLHFVEEYGDVINLHIRRSEGRDTALSSADMDALVTASKIILSI